MRGRRGSSILAAGALLAAVAAAPALAQGLGQPVHRPFAAVAGGVHPLVWAVGLFTLLRAVLLVSLIALAWRALGTRGLWHRPDGAAQVLRERYARGAIGDDEYRTCLATLA